MGCTSPLRMALLLPLGLVSMRLEVSAVPTEGGAGGSSWLYAGGGVPACRLNGD